MKNGAHSSQQHLWHLFVCCVTFGWRKAAFVFFPRCKLCSLLFLCVALMKSHISFHKQQRSDIMYYIEKCQEQDAWTLNSILELVLSYFIQSKRHFDLFVCVFFCSFRALASILNSFISFEINHAFKFEHTMTSADGLILSLICSFSIKV